MVGDYYYGTGRRKSSVARVFLKPGKGDSSWSTASRWTCSSPAKPGA